jgi:hypothetical protein
MKVLCHHIYEYKKGLRDLVLHTLHPDELDEAVEKLRRSNIPYVIRFVNSTKVNIFFGDNKCLDVIKSFGEKPLNTFTDEEDFILGIMLGYSRSKQYTRYIKRKSVFVNTSLSNKKREKALKA